jgi:5-methylcytosine-specific restriction protein A
LVTAHPRKPCTSPGCPNRVLEGRCETHSRHARRQRDNWTSLYGTAWPAIRLDYLRRHPRCVLCARLATVADHHPRGIRLLIKQRNPDPHADRHLRALCAPCHSQETGRREPGGWNAR